MFWNFFNGLRLKIRGGLRRSTNLFAPLRFVSLPTGGLRRSDSVETQRIGVVTRFARHVLLHTYFLNLV